MIQVDHSAARSLPGNAGERVLSLLERELAVPEDLRRQLRSFHQLENGQLEKLETRIVEFVWLFAGGRALALLEQAESLSGGNLTLYPRDTAVVVNGEPAVVTARNEAGKLATKVGFRMVEKTKFMTAVSELARNIYMYARSGNLHFQVRLSPMSGITVEARDRGPGIPNLEEIMGGTYRSKSGLGMGLRGVKSISSDFSIDSKAGQGTTVRATFYGRNLQA